MPPSNVLNPNLRRRPLTGLLALAATAPFRPLLPFLRRRAEPGAPVLVFASYMVGDLFMALPALRRLAAAVDVLVLCRPDCVGIVEREGLRAVPFDNAFFARRAPGTFLRALRAARRLRSLPAGSAIDLDASPASALWLRLGGAARVVSYRRPFGALFDETFPLPPDAVHQADRDREVVEGFLRRHPAPRRGALPENRPGGSAAEPAAEASSAESRPWLLSVWTRKAAKNWPLERWERFMDALEEEGVPFEVLHAPDGDAEYRAFRARRSGRTRFVEGSLDAVAARARDVAGVVATDNFLGHMAGYYGKPVLWINVSSPADQVTPRGPRTVTVAPEVPGVASSLGVDAVRRAFAALRRPAPGS